MILWLSNLIRLQTVLGSNIGLSLTSYFVNFYLLLSLHCSTYSIIRSLVLTLPKSSIWFYSKTSCTEVLTSNYV